MSEDLDFTGLSNAPTGSVMEEAIAQASKAAAEMMEEFAPVEIVHERYLEKDPHPEGQEAFIIRARLPWQRQVHTRVMIEVTLGERVLKPPLLKKIIHEYGEPLDAEVLVYTLEEIIGEKLRAILEHAEKLKQRGWSRSRARDYYDLWRILSAYREQLDFIGFSAFLREKCEDKYVGFSGAEDFFKAPMLDFVEKTWVQWLGPLVPSLPSFHVVISELREQMAEII